MRNNIIDFIRGIAFILMLIHHIYYFNPNTSVPNHIEIIGKISRTIFIILVGVCMSIFNNNNNNNKYKTSWKTLKYALIVSLVTYLLLPHNNIIFFGVLHFITFSTFLMKNISSNISLTILIGILSVLLNNISFKYLGSSDIINLIFNGYSRKLQPIDIFPIFKFLPYVISGIILGKYIKDNNILPESKINKPIEFIGKYSLELYLIHIIPCIFWMKNKNNYIS